MHSASVNESFCTVPLCLFSLFHCIERETIWHKMSYGRGRCSKSSSFFYRCLIWFLRKNRINLQNFDLNRITRQRILRFSKINLSGSIVLWEEIACAFRIPGILCVWSSCDPIPKILELASQVFLSDSLWAVSKIMVVKNFIKRNNPRDVQGLTVTLLFGCCAWSMPSSETEDCSVQVLFWPYRSLFRRPLGSMFCFFRPVCWPGYSVTHGHFAKFQ